MDREVMKVLIEGLRRAGYRCLDDLSHDQRFRLADALRVTVPEMHRAVPLYLRESRGQELAALRGGPRCRRIVKEREAEIAALKQRGHHTRLAA